MFTPRESWIWHLRGLWSLGVHDDRPGAGHNRCAVTVCDGAGTVIAQMESRPGMGGYISGLKETDPIPEVIEGFELGRHCSGRMTAQ